MACEPFDTEGCAHTGTRDVVEISEDEDGAVGGSYDGDNAFLVAGEERRELGWPQGVIQLEGLELCFGGVEEVFVRWLCGVGAGAKDHQVGM